MTRVAVGAAILAVAVLVWPRRRWPTGLVLGVRSAQPSTAVGLRAARLPSLRALSWRRGLWWGMRRRGRRRTADEEVAEVLVLLDALAPALRAGLPPADALRAVAPAAGEPPPGLLADLLHAADSGEPLSAVWRARAHDLVSGDVGLVASAWSLCEQLGAPLAPTVSTVGAVLRERRAVQRRVDAALAGPRASVTVLTALPAVGPLLALVMGISPLDLYASPPGAASLLGGLVLLAGGRWWVSRLVRSVGLDDSRNRVGVRHGGRDG